MVVVFDENAFIFSYTLQNEKDEEDTSAAALASLLAEKCWKFALDQELLRRYSAKADWVKATGRAVSGQSLLSLLMTNPEKLVYPQTYARLEREEEIPDDDRPIAKLARSTGAILITTDNRLIERLTSSSVADANNLRMLRPEEALHLAREGQL